MANEEHLKRLSQGVEVWNKWKEENALVAPDLGGANLEQANLIGARLTGADLTGTQFYRADLTDAKLN